MREAENLAVRLNDDRRRAQVCIYLTNIHSLLSELDEALLTGARALEIAGRLGDLRLRIAATSVLEQAHYFRCEYERVVELATGNLAALTGGAARPEELAGWVGTPVPITDRTWLVWSLAHLGRFAEAAQHEAELSRLVEQTPHAYAVGTTRLSTGWLHLVKSDWMRARSLFGDAIRMYRTANIGLLYSVSTAPFVWILAQTGEASQALTQLREVEELLEREAANEIRHSGDAYCWLGRADLLLGRLDEARSFADRAEARLEAIQVSFVDPDLVPVPIPVERRLPDPEDVDGVRVVERLQANKQDFGAAARLGCVAVFEECYGVGDIFDIHREWLLPARGLATACASPPRAASVAAVQGQTYPVSWTAVWRCRLDGRA